MAGETVAATRATDSWQPVAVTATEPVVTFDVGLGREFDFVDVPPPATKSILRSYGLDDSQTRQTRVYFDTTPPYGYDDSHTDADCPDGTVVVYTKNIVNNAKQYDRDARDMGIPVVDLSSRLTERMSATLAHEYSHLAEEHVLGHEAVTAEHIEHDLREARRRAWPEKLMAIGSVGIMTAGIAYSEELAGSVEGAGAIVKALAVMSALATGGTAAIAYAHRRNRYTTGASWEVYHSRPGEIRARDREAVYNQTHATETALVLVFARGEMPEATRQRIHAMASPTIT